MKKTVPKYVVEKEWRKIHPKKPVPPVKAYYVNKRTLNKIADESFSNKGKFKQTKEEYGKPVSTRTHTFEGVHYKQGREHVILVHKQNTQRKTGNIIRHELKHIRG